MVGRERLLGTKAPNYKFDKKEEISRLITHLMASRVKLLHGLSLAVNYMKITHMPNCEPR
jgi:hypothetical protein